MWRDNAHHRRRRVCHRLPAVVRAQQKVRSDPGQICREKLRNKHLAISYGCLFIKGVSFVFYLTSYEYIVVYGALTLRPPTNRPRDIPTHTIRKPSVVKCFFTFLLSTRSDLSAPVRYIFHIICLEGRRKGPFLHGFQNSDRRRERGFCREWEVESPPPPTRGEENSARINCRD